MISVIFSSRNGEETLPVMLEAFCYLKEPAEGWEIIAIDNASTDKTSIVINSFTDKLPITCVYEKKQGKNYALNTGVALAKGDLIIFTDDDVIPEPDWLVNLAECVNLHQDYTIFGGVIKPCWPREPEKWIVEHVPLGVTYALTEEDREEGEIFPGLVWGANMAIRKKVFDADHRFDVSIGPSGKNYVMGSETEFTIRLHKSGYKSWFCSNAVVQHIIRDYQLDPGWIVKRAYRFGRNIYRQESKSFDPDIPKLFGIPRWRFARLLQEYQRFVVSLLLRKREKKLNALWEIEFLKGYLYESLIHNGFVS